MKKFKSFGIISLYSKKGKRFQRFEGAGIGKEVSTKAKKLKEIEEKRIWRRSNSL